MKSRSMWKLLPGFVALAVCLASPPSSPAAEPAKQFLDALRRAGYHDVAVDYLDWAQTSKIVPAEFRRLLHYERGVTLIEASREQRDVAIREQTLDQAQESLLRFARSQPDDPKALTANTYLGNLQVERGRMKIEQADKPNAKNADALRDEARELYIKGHQTFERAIQEIKNRLEKYPKVIPKEEREQIAQREQLRMDYLQAKLLAAAVKEEHADTEEEGSAENKNLLKQAADEYGKIYEDYRTLIAGLYARMYQGRCYLKMQDYQEASSYFVELLDQPDQPDAFRTLKTKTFLLAVDAWLAQKQHAEATSRLGAWVDSVRQNESKEEEWLVLRYKLAKAEIMHAEALKESSPADATRSMKNAKKLLSYTVKYKSDVQKEARKDLAAIGGPDATAADGENPKTYEDAKTAGMEALDAIKTANLIKRTVPDRINAEKDPAIKAELQERLAAADKTIEDSVNKAFQYFSLALTLADDTIANDDIGTVRYFICFLHFSRDEPWEAAVIGEFLARRYPDSAVARLSAKIAMASYLKMYAEAPEDQRDFETARITGIAKYITEKWEGQPEAEEALNTLIPFMIQQGKLEVAQQYMEMIPEERRGAAELKTGQAMWSDYLTGMRELKKPGPDGAAPTANATREAELDQLKADAQAVLNNGVARMRELGRVDSTFATAMLSLAQIRVDSQQAVSAVSLLEDEEIGLLNLVKAEHPAVSRKGFESETYKTALRAYISSLADTSVDAPGTIAKAQAVMADLKASVGDDAAAQRRLIAIYVSLARQLQEQMKLIDDPTAKKNMSAGFEKFLKQIGGEATEFNIINWVAETFYGMAEAFDPGGTTPLPTEAKEYYSEAADTYNKIIATAEKDAAWIGSPQMTMQIQMRLAMTKRRLRKMVDAIGIFEDVLKKQATMLNVQVEAAKTYMIWADLDRRDAPSFGKSLYAYSIAGSKKDKREQVNGEKNKNHDKNIIWGWYKLSKVTGGAGDKFRNTFFEARYNMALCYYKYANRKKSDKDENRKYLGKAKDTIKFTKKLYPELGEWNDDMEELLRTVQRSLGEPAAGFREFEETTDNTVAGRQ